MSFDNIEQLKNILSSKSIEEVIYEHIFTKPPICFGGNHNLIFKLKKELSKHFKIHTKEIEIVGSAKLGLSLNPNKTGRYGKKFDNESDIDLVIVSSSLFDIAWNSLLQFDLNLSPITEIDRYNLESSYKTIHRGFVSPDRLPSNDFYRNWWSIFESLTNTKETFENRKIRGRLFKNWWFVEKYYSLELTRLTK